MQHMVDEGAGLRAMIYCILLSLNGNDFIVLPCSHVSSVDRTGLKICHFSLTFVGRMIPLHPLEIAVCGAPPSVSFFCPLFGACSTYLCVYLFPFSVAGFVWQQPLLSILPFRSTKEGLIIRESAHTFSALGANEQIWCRSNITFWRFLLGSA